MRFTTIFIVLFFLIGLVYTEKVDVEGKIIVSLHNNDHERIQEVVEEVMETLPQSSGSSGPVVTRVWERFGKFAMENVDESHREIISSHSAIRKVHRSQIFTTSKYSWGIRRIRQPELDLTGDYDPTFTGSGVDVYVLDTGLDF